MEPIFLPKLLTVLRKGYSREQFTRDLMAGVIVGIVALPLAIAFAIASGVGPEKGLITAIIAGFIISLLGGSRVQIGGPTGAFVVIVASIIGAYGIDGLIISTIMAGIIMVLFGVLKLGVVIRFIPYPLTVGFTSGIALLIFTTQIKDFFGMNTGDLPADFIGKMGVLATSFDSVNWAALGIGAMSILITIFWSKITTRIPGSLIALILSVVLVTVFGLQVDTIGSKFGEISATFPKTVTRTTLNINAINEPGIRVVILLQKIVIRILIAPIPNAAQLTESKDVARTPILPIKSAGISPVFIPKKSLICVVNINSAIPLVNPTVKG